MTCSRNAQVLTLVSALASSVVFVPLVANAQADVATPTLDTAFELEFGVSDVEYGSRIRQLRIAGWTLIGAGTTAALGVLVHGFIVDSNAPYGRIIAYSVAGGLGGLATIVGSMLLLGSRIKVGRRARFRRRFRERQTALDRSYFNPEVDIGITPGGLSLHLSF